MLILLPRMIYLIYVTRNQTAIMTKLTFAFRRRGGAFCVCCSVERTRPATRLPPLRLIKTLWTRNTCIYVTFPIVTRFARNYQRQNILDG